ncbi:hypothetical protein DCO58_00170 [Helicobacter saguini]|uniref:Phage-Barnase-EndoU-ColicinE5/D-RelE like nuclease 3 domain-containing protein n=1 Tax=Helicobacter saguini TaxID=1548018 RepID=A0A099B6U3_9HELI|nr:hypothetical protein [Helicobacter saguini]MWV63192.1 hypothetical protein [Helicobacter saguini]MWV66138.1 hypothetical protein [Helicobacter saguini]MWV68488.1 hypothetical protein [Helicobacter saguini]MWV71958.1 hypothetical protein [Helicobacter saguini]TLD95966.1 hypothetical protein LS64_000980 [Helicobacter saguini]
MLNKVSNGNIDYSKFKDLQELPKPKKFNDFRNSLLNSPNCIKQINKNKIIYQTKVGQVQIYIPYAYGHFAKNGKFGNGKENRQDLTGVLNLILDKPAFVTKDTQGTLYFYKPFVINNEFKDVISISIDSNGKLEYRTTYESSNTKVKNIMNHELVYIE